jgi:hypothetical protein
MSIERVFIPINSLSALIDRNPHRDMYCETTSVISRYYPDINDAIKQIHLSEIRYREQLRQLDLLEKSDPDKTYRDNFLELTSSIPDIKPDEIPIEVNIDANQISIALSDKLEEHITTENIESAGSVRCQMDNLIETVKCSDAYVDKLAANNIRSFRNRFLGKIRENSVISKLQELDRNIRDEQKIYRLDLETPSQIPYRLYGKVDCIEYLYGKPVAVVEIKNRMMRFQVPEYDLDQLAMYIYMSKIEKGYLVQQLNGELEIGPELSYEEAEKRYLDHIQEPMFRWIEMINDLPREFSEDYTIELSNIAFSMFGE